MPHKVMEKLWKFRLISGYLEYNAIFVKRLKTNKKSRGGMTQYIITDNSRQITIKQEQETGEHKYTVYSESILVSISESLQNVWSEDSQASAWENICFGQILQLHL